MILSRDSSATAHSRAASATLISDNVTRVPE